MTKVKCAGILMVFILLLATLIPGQGLATAGSTSAGSSWEGVHITFATQSMPGMLEIAKLVPEFEKQTGIKVTVDLMNYDSLVQKVTLDVKSGTKVYDCFWMEPTWLGRFEKELEPLESYISDPVLGAGINFTDFPPAVLDIATYHGETLALPLFSGMWLLAYRKDLYDQHGLSVPSTYDEYLSNAEKLHNPPEIYGVSVMGKKGWGVFWEYLCYLWSFGGELFDESGSPSLNTPEALRALRFLVNLKKQFAPPGVTSWDWTESATAFMQGKVAHAIVCDDWISTFEDPSSSKVIGKWAFASLPAQLRDVQVSAGAGIGINRDIEPRRKEATFVFIKWMVSEEIQKRIIVETGGFGPSRLSVLNARELMEDPKYFYFETMADAILRLRAPLKQAESFELVETLGARLSEALMGSRSPEDALQLAEKEWRKILKL